MRIRTIAAAFVVAAPLLALGSPQAAACWETGYRYGYSSPAYRGYYGGVGIRRVGYRGCGLAPWLRIPRGWRWPGGCWPGGCWPRRGRRRSPSKT